MIGFRAARRVSVGVQLLSIGLVASTALLATTHDADAARRRAKRPAGAVSVYNPPSSAIVIDANNGRVLYAKDADEIRHPASITKVMTLYLLFEELEAGRMTLDTPLTVSKYAASQSPTKLGLRPGSTIRVEDAIKSLVTLSANDMAVTIAENIGGSEADFADRMTRKARALGMTQTQYRNASGLPNSGQLTSARDLAILGIKIQERFPRYYAYFQTRVFVYGSRKIGNHNRLLGRVEGVDGIKTGFVNASGFNLLTSIRRDGRHLVAVVLGGRTASSRDATMRELIALNLPRGTVGDKGDVVVAKADPVQRAKPAVVADIVTPADRGAKTPTRTASTVTPASLGSRTPDAVAQQPAPAEPVEVAEAALPAPAPLPAPRPIRVSTPAYAAAPAAQPQMPSEALAYASEPTLAPSLRWMVGAKPVSSSGMARLIEPTTSPAPKRAKGVEVASLEMSGSPEPALSIPTTASAEPAEETASTPAEPAVAAVPTPARDGWFVQVGASPSSDGAEALLSQAKRASQILSSAEPFTETVEKGASTLYRARFAGLDKVTAQKACAALKRADMSCFAIKN